VIGEDQLEQLAIQWFRDTGWTYASGADLAPEGASPERADFRAVVLKGRPMSAVQRLNPNRMIESSQVIAEMIAMAKDMQAALKRDEDPGLNPDEIAFYDALAEKPEVLQTMGDATLKKLATELTEKLRSSTAVDWQV
jgi:type I site-specific restriction-modification system R (restriction) subunit